MENNTSVISVQVSTIDKEKANEILKNLGLNMSTYVNMAIKQLINKDGIPFEVRNPKPSKELLEALQEGEDIIKDIKAGKRKPYNSAAELFASLDEE